MDPAKLEALRNRIKDVQSRNDARKTGESSNESKDTCLKDHLGIYKITRNCDQPSFVYSMSDKRDSFHPGAGYEKNTEFGKCFYRKKIFIDRIGTVAINNGQELLTEIKKFDHKAEAQEILLRKSVFLDIETTSIESGAGNCAYIIGLGYFDEGCFVVEQYFMRDFDEEASMIVALNENLSRFTTLFSYNGKTFDINVLQTRASINRIPLQIDGVWHIDMLQIYRKIYGRKAKRLNLVNLEKELLGIERINDIPSQLVPEVYYQYLQRGYTELLEYVFEHNAQDIASLAGLTLFLESALQNPSDFHEIAGYIYCALGESHKRKKFLSEAQRFYELALEAHIEPAIYSKVCYELARIYIRNQDYAGASELWMKLITLYPECMKSQELKRLAIHFEHYDKDLTKAFYFAAKGSEEIKDNADFEKRVARIFKKMLKGIKFSL